MVVMLVVVCEVVEERPPPESCSRAWGTHDCTCRVLSLPVVSCAGVGAGAWMFEYRIECELWFRA